MDVIELERWKRSETEPGRLEYVGQRTAQEVFGELKYRLDRIGYLPAEYFLLSPEWEDGKEIPRDADIYCTVDYGGNEGIYLDIYLKWFDKTEKKNVTRSFITGKTLEESGSELDRMFLIASAVTKAFHGDHAVHERYMLVGGEENLSGAVLHLNSQEQQVLMDALVEQRERQENAMSQTEQILRRMAGSITGYMDMVGQRPLRLSDYDKAMLAIRDGELSAFKELYPDLLKEHTDELLIEAAGRPGSVGRKMTLLLLVDAGDVSEQVYRAACKKAVGINDSEKVAFLLDEAKNHVPGLSLAFYGEIAREAYVDHKAITKKIIDHCSNEQIAAAPFSLMEMFAMDRDYSTMRTLVEKGICSKGNAARTLHMLTSERQSSWMAETLLQKRMWVDARDYAALHACIKNDAVNTAKLLLEGGMGFDEYRQWAVKKPVVGHEETMQELADHWAGLKGMDQPEDQENQQEMEGMNFV